jgi:putative NADH-flavin reductase
MKDKLMPKLLSRFCLITLILTTLLASGQLAAETDSPNFRVLVYGATGKVGSQAVNEALKRGHIVTAVSRDPSRITASHQNLIAVKGDILDPDSVTSLVASNDVVIISVRGVLGKSKDPNDAVPRIAVENVVNVLRGMEKPAPRLIHVGGSGSLVVKPGVVYADTLPMIFVPRALQTEIEGQVLALEYLRSVSDVDWTYATPAKNFTNGKRTGVFRIGGDQLIESKSGRSRISRADFAVALIDEVENAEFVQQRFSVVY